MRYTKNDPFCHWQSPCIKEMAKHAPDAGSYAPVTVLVDERRDRVHLSYDRMANFLAPSDTIDALKIAKELMQKWRRCLPQPPPNDNPCKTTNEENEL